MTETLKEMQQDLEAFIERRRQVEKELDATSDPDDRAYLAGKVARMMDHEEATREILRKIELVDKLEPLFKEAIAALDTGDQTTTRECLTWHATKGNQFAKDLLTQMTGATSQTDLDPGPSEFLIKVSRRGRG